MNDMAEKTAEEIAAEQTAAQAATEAKVQADAELAAKEEEAKAKLEAANAEAEKAKAEAAAAKVELAFANLSKKTPAAEAHKADILAKAQASNLSLEEASILVLAQKGVSTVSPPSGDLGGGANQRIETPAFDSSKMTQEQRAEKIKAMSPEEFKQAFTSLNIGG
jgi:hypothetical protein